ncbi:AraC family transcriptional regulator [Variovorax paradoxus]|nr:AraC family transcriptional regulator [Variovorax paradoxus]
MSMPTPSNATALVPPGQPERDPLSDLLDLVHIRGEMALTCTPATPFALSFPAGASSMHAVTHGTVSVRVEGLADAVRLGPGELILLPHGTAHVIEAGDARTLVDIWDALKSGFDRTRSALGQGTSPVWFWGSFRFDSAISRRLLDTLPLAITLRELNERPLEWFQLCWEIMIDETRRRLPGGSVMVSRLLDIVFVKVIRRWAEQDAAAPHWLTASLDPRIANVLSAIHAAPARPWQVADLAEIAGMSRSSFAARFESLLTQPPGAYLTAWRLDKATERLRNSARSIRWIAEDVGYESDAAFSRAFRERFGVSPSQWRKQAQAANH